MNITVLGHVCIDHNQSEGTSYVGAGGPAIFIKKIFEQLPSCSVHIITPYGSDMLACAPDLNLYPNTPTMEKSLVYENMSEHGQRTQKVYNVTETSLISLDEDIIEILKTTDILFISPLTPVFSPEYLAKVMAYVSKTTLKVLLPQGYFRDFDTEHNVITREFTEADKVLPLVDVVVLSEEDYPRMRELVESWRAYGIVVVMTLGEKGVMAFHKREEITVATDPVLEDDVVDSVGSGDIFSASFAYDYYNNKNLRHALTYGNMIARQCLFFAPDDIRIKPPKF